MTLNRHWLMTGAAVVGALALGFGVSQWLGRSPASSDTAAAEAEDHPGDRVALSAQAAARLGVAIVTVGRGDGGELTLPGRVAVIPGGEATVDAPLAGVVVAVHVGPGDPVRRGAALATLRSPDGAAARAEVDAARASLQAAQSAEQRDRTLFDQGWLPQARLDISAAEARRAEAQLRAARARLAAYGDPGSDGRVIVRSPIAGVVTRISAAPGQVLHQEALQVAAVADARRTELAFEAPPQAGDQLRIGSAVRVTAPGARAIPAIVTAIAPVNAAGVVVVRARADGDLPAAGTVVSARIAGGTGQGAPVVPVTAVQTVEGVPSVFVFDGDGFRARPVVTGTSAGGFVEIASGLQIGERIAGDNAFLLKSELGRGEAEHAH